MTVTGNPGDFTIDVTATATEPNGSEASRTLSVGPNFDPDAVDDSGEVKEGHSLVLDVLDNDTDLDGDTLVISEVDGQSVEAGDSVDVDNGTVTINQDGTITFTANDGYEGPTDFTYTISDGAGGTDTATVNLEILDGNVAPVAGDDMAETAEDTPVVINLLDDDTDADGDVLSITAIDGQDIEVGDTITLTDGSGAVTLHDDGTVTFDPADNFNGQVDFDYTITDGEKTDTATVSVDVASVNDGPEAQADEADTLEDNSVTFDPLANDSDIEK